MLNWSCYIQCIVHMICPSFYRIVSENDNNSLKWTPYYIVRTKRLLSVSVRTFSYNEFFHVFNEILP